MGSNTTSLSFGDVEEALARIAPHVHPTPVLSCRSINERAGAQLFFKSEHLQRVGAFKFRGACNAICQLNKGNGSHGVVTHSSGNHAQAVALAARLQGIPAYIVMPTAAPQVKRDAVVGYGATVIDCEPTLDARESTAERVQRETGAEFIHPYNDPRIIAGQGTAALELTREIPDLHVLVTPIGGGGLVSGTCLVANAQPNPPRVVGGEPSGADDAWRSKQAGQLIPQTSPQTVADGLLTSLGSLTWPFVRDEVHSIITIGDAEIVSTMRFFWERTKQIIEASSAVAVAAAIREARGIDSRDLRVGVILSGGNVDLDRLPWIS